MCSLEIEVIFAKMAKMAILDFFPRTLKWRVRHFFEKVEKVKNFKILKNFKIFDKFFFRKFFFFFLFKKKNKRKKEEFRSLKAFKKAFPSPTFDDLL